MKSIIVRILIGFIGILILTFGRVVTEARSHNNVDSIISSGIGDGQYAFGTTMTFVGVFIVGAAIFFMKNKK